MIERWQEYDCPESGIDFDLHSDEMVYEGDLFYCPGCGSMHAATADLITQYEVLEDETDMFARPVPLQRRF